MKRSMSLTILALCLFCSCTTKMSVKTSALALYPELEENEPVQVYYRIQNVPVDSEIIGSFRVRDGGLTPTKMCDSVSTVEIVKAEARKIGGNAVHVTDHIRPSIMGSTCHQMYGDILRVHDFSQTEIIEESTQIENQEDGNFLVDTIGKPTYPKFRIAGNIGYGWRTAKVIGSSGAERDFLRELNSGIAYDGDMTFYFSEQVGIGINYTALTGNTNKSYNISNYPIPMEGKSLLKYIGVDYAMRTVQDGDWMLDARLGLGYADYKITYTSSQGNELVKEWGATVGLHASIGIDYMLAKQWGLGLKLSTIYGLVSTFHIQENGGRIETTHIDDISDDPDFRIGLGQIRLTAGIRYYLPY